MPDDTLTVELALHLVDLGECQWVRQKIWINGRTLMREVFNCQRNQPDIHTDLVNGDVWYGHPTRPLTMDRTFEQILADKRMRAVADGDDFKMYEEAIETDGSKHWVLSHIDVGGVTKMANVFNEQRGQPLDTAIVDGDSWTGYPTFPITCGQSIQEIVSCVMYKIIVEGDDIVMYSLAQVE